MKIRLAIWIFAVGVLPLICGACIDNEGTDNRSANASSASKTAEIVPQDDLEALAKIVKLNFTPADATFIEINPNNHNTNPNVPAPNEQRLVAVLRFAPADAAQIAERAVALAPAAPNEIDAENWFPAELIAQSQLAGDESLKGTAYAADDFKQAPYVNGRLTRINDTDFFVLELTTF